MKKRKQPNHEQLELPFLVETKRPLFKEMEEVQVRLMRGNIVSQDWYNAHIVTSMFPNDDSAWIVQYPSGRIVVIGKEHIRRIER